MTKLKINKMNWKTKLAEQLSHRKKENNAEGYIQLLKEVILPTFKEIEAILCNHHIDANISNSNNELIVKLGNIDWFSMKMMLDYDKMKIEFSIADTSEPTLEPKLKLENSKTLAFEDVTEEKIGKEFYKAFKPLFKLYNSGKE